ncbi:GNAT family N-acetyltransferase [Nonlabens ulvanivorans]|uniref:GNAT family N-acetyltransferase n=1 Tax=Nonlabens ulvanivorans TaxID=906888 RepID=UPI0029435AC7|nr:GNAT family N-acetyltransferase [Nonlabens ulvanivorans]WOI24023.1 GNAT family N-acetyltransferase [Nonlabens ulvanivorans]
MKSSYKSLNTQVFSFGEYQLVPIRYEDRLKILDWRNQQMYHLRQATPLTKKDQDYYFSNTVSALFDQDNPSQILFSFLRDDVCIGYGGLVHINWVDKNAEISFIMDSTLEKDFFEDLWFVYLGLIEKVGFHELGFHKIFTYAFDLRPRLYVALEKAGFHKEVTLKEHCLFEEKFIDVIIHSLIADSFVLKKATLNDVQTTFNWASNPAIRSFSFNQNKILLKDHIKWFNNKLCDYNCEYFIAYDGINKVGSIRFDITNNNALLSYLIDPEFHGKGFGTQILKDGIMKLKNIRSDVDIISGFVIPENKASVYIFNKLQFDVETVEDNLYFSLKIK